MITKQVKIILFSENSLGFFFSFKTSSDANTKVNKGTTVKGGGGMEGVLVKKTDKLKPFTIDYETRKNKKKTDHKDGWK